MPTMNELDQCYMSVALAHSKLSKAKRKKVGACLVTSNGIIVPGVNGLAAGGSNECEEKVWESDYHSFGDMGEYKLVTKPQVIHAELSCILKCAKEQVSCLGCKIYVNLSPCLVCSEMLAQAGVSEVIYLEEYRDTSGIDNLKKHSIIVRKINFIEE